MFFFSQVSEMMPEMINSQKADNDFFYISFIIIGVHGRMATCINFGCIIH